VSPPFSFFAFPHSLQRKRSDCYLGRLSLFLPSPRISHTTLTRREATFRISLSFFPSSFLFPLPLERIIVLTEILLYPPLFPSWTFSPPSSPRRPPDSFFFFRFPRTESIKVVRSEAEVGIPRSSLFPPSDVFPPPPRDPAK